MEDLFQVKNTLIEKIDALLEKISKIDDERYIINRDQAYLIISNPL